MFEFGHASLDLLNVEVHVVREVRAAAGLGVAHRAVQRRPAHADHHGSQTQEEEERPRVSAHFICRVNTFG